MIPVELLRESRLAAGTLVGITAPAGSHAAAWAAMEAEEARLSEWRADSLSARASRGEAVRLPADTLGLFRLARAVERRSDGAFSLTFSGGSWSLRGDRLQATGPLGLGGVLKGWLVDRAAEALEAQGVRRYLVDAAGDLRVGGSWRVEVEGLGERILTDEAISSSGESWQPGHIRDPRSGEPVTCSALAVVTAPESAWADALATALYASCGRTRLPAFAAGTWRAAEPAPAPPPAAGS